MRDPYLFTDCNVLRNILGIKDEEALNIAEVDISCKAIHDLFLSPINGSYNFEHFCETHRRIFSNIYDWAGFPRTIHIEKPERLLAGMSIEYSQPDAIEKDISAVLSNAQKIKWDKVAIEDQAKAVADNLASLWKAHAFREGNTRTTVTFFCDFIESKNITLDRTLFQQHAKYMRDALVVATAVYKDGTDFRQHDPLLKIVTDSLQRGLNT